MLFCAEHVDLATGALTAPEMYVYAPMEDKNYSIKGEFNSHLEVAVLERRENIP